MLNKTHTMNTTQTPTAVRTIDINAKQWFDKVNGNSYFAGVITVNYGTPEAQAFKMPYQYGYGDQYIHEAISLLNERGVIDATRSQLKDAGVIIRTTKHTGCKKAELKNI